MASVVTRIAPSPTGYMHIGTARTALFNWLFARSHGGRFLLRVEDTDRARYTPEAVDAILHGMRWLGLDYDGEAVSQFERVPRHREVAQSLIDNGMAYKCFATQDEIEAFREKARAEGSSTLFRSPWRDADPSTHPDTSFVIRIKAPRDGQTIVEDAVQGRVTWANETLDDLVLLRSDGTPTYMLAVVVDDFDMGVTHVIRGDDHLSNVPRQMLIYKGMGWPLPTYAHLPLILGADGKKLSKRHGATGVEEYQKMGYPAAGMRNYLTRLGWSHGDDEFFTDAQAKEWFDLDGITKSAARFDAKKLEHLCGQHIAASADGALLEEISVFLRASNGNSLTDSQAAGLGRALYSLKDRAKTFPELLEKAHFVLASRPIEPDDKSAKALNSVSIGILQDLTSHLQNVSWVRTDLEESLTSFAESKELSFGKLAQPLRAALAGRTVTPSVYDMMLVIGRDETLGRLTDATGTAPQ
ncbi:MAG: glutamate--tRNA ligase [Pseudomonadota bacterium]